MCIRPEFARKLSQPKLHCNSLPSEFGPEIRSKILPENGPKSGLRLLNRHPGRRNFKKAHILSTLAPTILEHCYSPKMLSKIRFSQLSCEVNDNKGIKYVRSPFNIPPGRKEIAVVGGAFRNTSISGTQCLPLRVEQILGGRGVGDRKETSKNV